ncbi:hypothetical protein OG21DRAFT_1434639 [Imleria badia]|nr:hypothetical protein OG21DRAFT_1434639 [Imleria badia]
MSAVRRNDRRVNRNSLASPYTRPLKSDKVHPPKKSPWSLSGLISFLNPFNLRDSSEPEDSDSGPSDGEIEQGPPPRRFSPPPPPLPPPPPPPQHQSSSNSSRPSGMNGPGAGAGLITQSSPNDPFSLTTPSPAPSGSSLAKNLEPVTRFLVEKAGVPLNEFEAAGIVDYIQKNVQGSTFVPDKPEPFRFSVSPSRAVSPNPGQGIGNMQTPRKTLSRNPNGVYRWQGAGSSRPRNRYQSPGFAPRPQQHRIKLSPPKTPVATDTKRRRVGDEAESSTPQRPGVPSTSTVSFPSSAPESPVSPSRHATGLSPSFLNGKPTVHAPALPATPKANGVQPRVRTSGLAMKPTTPAIPSPLRQTWKESDSPPQASAPSRPTRAADFMTGLIKEVTPTKKPDVSNPYQTASPVKPPAPVRKPVAKRARVAKPAEKPKEQEPDLSAQTIIEATVPKGTKRSRPPAEMEKPTRVGEVSDNEPFTSAPNGSTHTTRSTFNVIETITILEGEESPSKRRKTPPARPSSKAQEIDEASAPKATIRPAEIIEPNDVVHINGKPAAPPPPTSPPSSTKLLFGVVKTSAPKEPSKLRYSFHADKVEVKSADAPPASSLPSFFAPSPVLPPLKSMAAPVKPKLSPKEEALAMSVDELPKYTFPVGITSSSPAGPSFSAARHAVLALAATSLPTYEFAVVIAPVRAMNGFNWTAAGLKAPVTVPQTWKCSVCELQNPADAKEKCAVCDSPRPAPTDSSSPSPAPVTPTSSTPPAPPTGPAKGFDWSAAGLAPPPKPQSGTWLCSVCSLSNPASATDKCTVCDAPR